MSRFMRLIVFFDLPTGTKEERKAATAFRNFLIKDGYYMIQFSVYGRLCNGNDHVEKHCARVRQNAPEYGSVRMLTVTEKQYASIRIIAGAKSPREKPAKFIQTAFILD